MHEDQPNTLIALLRRLIASSVGLARRCWQRHLRLLRSNTAYASALAAGLAAIASQDTLLDLAAAVAASVLAIYSAVRRWPAPR